MLAMLSFLVLAAAAVSPGPALDTESFVARDLTAPESIFSQPADELLFDPQSYVERVPVEPNPLDGSDSSDHTPFRDTPYDDLATVIRGQSPPYDESPQMGGPSLGQPQYLTVPPATQAAPWGQPTWPGTPLIVPNGIQGGPPPQSSVYGANGPQPFRFGWTHRFDVGYLPKERVSLGAGTGQFGVFEVNAESRYSSPLPAQWILSLAPQFNLRLWEGPTTPALHGDIYRGGLDIQLTSPTLGPYTAELAFNPSVNSDFDHNLTSDAWNFDGRGAVFVRTSPQWMFMLGALYWDRVNSRILPYAGVIYTPNDWFELRATFPRADMSLFLGTPWGVPQWLYVAGEYHVEAYQIEPITAGPTRERIELEDWRLMLGVRSDSGGISSFLEGGWVFGRNVDFAHAPASGFDISSGFIARFGMRF